MSTIRVIDIIASLEDILQDSVTANLRWTRLEKQRWINAAYREIVKLRPDVNTKTGTFECVAGSRQNLITTSGMEHSLRLLDITRNVAVGSNGESVRVTDVETLDDFLPGWQAGEGSINIQNYVYDEKIPTGFRVYPPALDTARLEVVYSAIPTIHAMTENELDPAGAEADVISIDDSYESNILDYALYRALSKNSGTATFAQRGAAHYEAFAMGLGVKLNVDQSHSPNEDMNKQ